MKPKFNINDTVYFLNQSSLLYDWGQIKGIREWSSLYWCYQISGQANYTYHEEKLFKTPAELKEKTLADIDKLQKHYDNEKRIEEYHKNKETKE